MINYTSISGSGLRLRRETWLYFLIPLSVLFFVIVYLLIIRFKHVGV